MLQTYPELRLPLEPFAFSLVRQALSRTPRAFRTYAFGALDLRAVQKALKPYDLDPWAAEDLAGVVWELATEKLRSLEARGIVQAVTTAPSPPGFDARLRAAEHPLLRLMADAAFGCALAEEAAAALAELRTLDGFEAASPGVVAASI